MEMEHQGNGTQLHGINCASLNWQGDWNLGTWIC
jgi:hypothetical protein